MAKVGIAQLKDRLSEYLRRVKKGERLIVLDRDEPVAEIVPHDEEARLDVVQAATRPWAEVERELRRDADRGPAPDDDQLADLLEDRGRRRF